jgi:NADH:ubiquinone reductase (non-electrogenic)
MAMGGETPLDVVAGVAEHCIPFRTVEDAYHLEEKLRQLETSNTDRIRVAVVGGGYSGVELACKLADRLQSRGRIRLIERNDAILRHAPSFNQEAAQQALQQKQVWIDLETSVTAVNADTMSLEYRGQVDTIPVDLVLWTVGTQVIPLVRSLPLKHNDRGQLITTSTLQVMDHPEIFALGDLADAKMLTAKPSPPPPRPPYSKQIIPVGIFGHYAPDDRCYPSAISLWVK